ncbi:DUF3846 domain-containing protein [Bacillus cereus]|uniref:DUF3846 domain-containing protein n=1 Tax=Bacillus cereus group TaxID=86661 RepID=UPI0022E53BE5|nr:MULTISPECIES: DUF3846 domain-containing protein [Bacillus cereus group]MDA1509610.1 DUF3846 domain-containing protein [Bacillus cereus group sp. TH36-2LC]MDZ4632273.1 DUF3846 domain-containing protein [Bacillus cereus]
MKSVVKGCVECGWKEIEGVQEAIFEDGKKYCPVCDGHVPNYIRVVIVETGSPEIKIIEAWEHSLENLQQFVGGYIEPIRIDESITMWLNEEGKMQGLEPNFVLVNKGVTVADTVVGNVLIAGTDREGNTISLTDKEIEILQEKFMSRTMFQL